MTLLLALVIAAAWSLEPQHYRNDWFELDYPAGWQLQQELTPELQVVALRSPEGEETCFVGAESTWPDITISSGHERRVATVLADYPGTNREGSPTDNLRSAGIERKTRLRDADGNVSWISTVLAAGALVTVTCSTPSGHSEQAAEMVLQSLKAGRPGKLRLTDPDPTAGASLLKGTWNSGRSVLVFRRSGTVIHRLDRPDHREELPANPQKGKYTVTRGLLRMTLSGTGQYDPVCVFRVQADRMRLYCLGWSDEAIYVRGWSPEEDTSVIGVLGLVLVSAAFLTLLFCFVSIELFRRAVVTLMHQVSDRLDASKLRALEPIHTKDDARSGSLWHRATAARKRLFAVYFVAGVCAASCLTVGATFDRLTAVQFFSIYPIVAWPLALTAREVFGWPLRQWLYVVAAYFALLLLLGLRLQLANPEFQAWYNVYLWALMNGFPTAAYYVLASTRVRTIGSLVFMLSTIAMAGMYGLAHLAGTDMRVMSILEAATNWAHMRTDVFVYTVYSGGVLLSAPVVYLAFRAAAGAYERRWFSEQALIAASIWVLFAVSQAAVEAVKEDVGFGVLWILSAAPCYFAVRAAGMKLLHKPRSGPALLVLRAFALGRKSERVCDAVAGLWRFVGPVYLIGGADLASRLIQPSSLLSFAARRLSSRFIDSYARLSNRLANLGGEPDPDGRFRVEEFFCYANTWETTVVQLALRSSAILMDFRTFSASRSGCERELRELLPIIPMDRFVVVVDRTTHRTYLSQIITQVLDTLAEDSPNYKATEGALCVVDLGNHNGRVVEPICKALFSGQAQRS